MDIPLLTIAAIFAVWWAISVCNQFRSGAWTLRLRRHIPLGLIPLWTFFAPNPARADSRLLWREEHGNEWGVWRELHFGFAPASSRWLVNPELIPNKAVTDLVGSLLRVRPKREDRSALLCSPYLTLLSIVLAQFRRTGCSSIQFAIVRTSTDFPARRVEVVFLSEVHDTADSVTHVYSS
ncbi:MAG TPA: hypothetical protein VF240_17120 [Pyrinomonadaceae bacterium]